MKELEIYLENDYDLYRQRFMPIIKNIKQKIKTGRYNHDLAPKLWMYFVEAGAKKYAKEYANASEWVKIFTKPDRIILAKKFADVYYDQIIEGNFD